MNKPKFIFLIAAFLLVGLLSPAAAFGQTENPSPRAEPSYEVVLQILVASSGAADKNNVPQELSNIVRKLKTTYALPNYRLTSTYLQRIANTGNVEFKSISTLPAQNQNVDAPVFSEWTLGRLQTMTGANGGSAIQLQNFRFGQRVPVRTASLRSDGGSTPVINYESIGLTMQKLNLSANVPTVVGSLSTSNPEELMFLVLTVKLAEE